MNVHRLIYLGLAADLQLKFAVGERIYEHVPARAEMPYIVIGEAASRPWNTTGDDGEETGATDDVTIHVWSREARRSEAETIVTRIHAALDFERLILVAANRPNMRLVNVVRGETRIERLPERNLVHATIRFRFTREDTE